MDKTLNAESKEMDKTLNAESKYPDRNNSKPGDLYSMEIWDANSEFTSYVHELKYWILS